MIFVEAINIYNLNLLNNIIDLIYDFVAFACICDFDDSMLVTLMSSRMRVFIAHDINFTQFRKAKVHATLVPKREGKSEVEISEKKAFDEIANDSKSALNNESSKETQSLEKPSKS